MTKQQKINIHFNQRAKLSTKNPWYCRQAIDLFAVLFAHDAGMKGDATTSQLVKKNKEARAVIIAKQNGILAGIEEAKLLLPQSIRVRAHAEDGGRVKKNDIILTLSGNAATLLLYERAILNLLQRMSGIATVTQTLMRKINHRALLCPTRKTPWGMLDKKAVAVGGGGTHRLGLGDWALVKENHLALLDSLSGLAQLKGFWEVEVETQHQALDVLHYAPDAVLFDNFSLSSLPETIKKMSSQLLATKNRLPILEASGGITAENIAQYGATGVDIISMGSLTQSTPVLDLSLLIC